jgi:hypothetical protein
MTEEEESPTDPDLIEEWKRLKSMPIDAPDFVKKIAPDWIPGQLLPEEVLFQIYKRAEFEEKYANWIKNSYRESFEFVRTHLDAHTAFQVFDDDEERKLLTCGAWSFTALAEQKQDYQEDAATLPTVPEGQLYRRPANDEMLAAQFKLHLQITQAWVYILGNSGDISTAIARDK